MKSTLLLALICSAVTALAQDNLPAAAALRFAPTPGDRLSLIVSDTTTDTEPPAAAPGPDALPEDRLKQAFAPAKKTVTEREQGFEWKIEKPDAAGNSVITVKYVYLRLVVTKNRLVRPSFSKFGGEEVVDPGQTFVLDTRLSIAASNPALRQPSEQSPQTKAWVDNQEWYRSVLSDTLMDQSFTLVVSPAAKVVAVKGMDEILDRFRERMKEKTERAERPAMDSLIESLLGEDNVANTFNLSVLLPLPEQPVRPGERWADNYSYEFSGLKVAITRRLQMDEAPAPDGTAALSGLMEFHFPEQKGRLVIDAKRAYQSINSRIDVATGVCRYLNSGAHLEVNFLDADAAQGAKPVLSWNYKLAGSVVVKRLSWRDPADNRFNVYPIANGAFQVRLGSEWAQIDADLNYHDSLVSIYKQANGDAEFIATVAPLSLAYQGLHPLDQMAEQLKKSLQVNGVARVNITWSKYFETGQVHWARFRVETTSQNGTQATNWLQFGYATSGQFTFALTRTGRASSDMDTEADAILNSIAARDQR